MRSFLIIIVAFITVFSFHCADNINLTEFEANKGLSGEVGDTLYVKLTPDWEGFSKPQDIHVGHDYFMYVADTDNDRVVMLNLNGEILGEKEMLKPVAISQDYRLNLLVCAKEIVNLSGGVEDTIDVVYKLDMFTAEHNIANAPITRLLPRPEAGISDKDLRYNYTGVTAFYNNDIYVARSGPYNTSYVDPDNSIIMFQRVEGEDGEKKDSLMGRLPNMEPLGTGLKAANYVSALFATSDRNRDYLYTMSGENSFKAQWLTYVVRIEGESYESRLSPGTNAMLTPAKFQHPEDIIIDDFDNIYVVDAEADSIYKFNAFGDEMESFGGEEVFNNPHGIAYHDKVIFIADTGNDRIVRYTLSTDIR